ncbi:Bidirectional sugar transporter SWEET6b [Carex littledalei]|uniref:Bidirectional sugar transporter SWEET n=1 Tax=Carex littledalei TaxID=544730 RepID=A0A833VNS0_9POAL|nr:Bidirectional sugar transporter SWEET6b [Carex littledalei]
MENKRFKAHMGTFTIIVRNRSVEQFSLIPYLTSLLSCMVSVMYALPIVHPNNILVLAMNGVGIIIEGTWITIYIFFLPTPPPCKILGTVAVELLLVGAFLAGVLRGAHTHDKRTKIASILNIVFNLVMYSSPLSIMTITGKIFKVDTIDGTVKEVLSRDSSMPLALSGHAIALQSKRSIAVATNQSVLLIESDNSWAQGVAIHKKMKMEEGKMVVAVAIRDGENVTVLVNSQKGYMIEEAVWGGSIKEYVYVLWCFILGSINFSCFTFPLVSVGTQ